jgi:adenosylhomocysteine nucleosidase
MIGLIAVRGEANSLLKFITIDTTTEHLQARFYQGQLAGRPVVLAEVSPGKIQTAAATQHLFDAYQARLMISCGSAGALAPQLAIGDIILADKITLHDFGLLAKHGFQHMGFYDHNYADGLHFQRMLPADDLLLATARQSALTCRGLGTAPTIHTGCLVSGDQVIADETKKQWLHQTFNALAVDMESGAMAQVAYLNNIPWLAIRAISDRADSSLDVGQLNFITYSDDPENSFSRLKKAARIAGTVVQNAGQIKQAWRLRQNIKSAAANAAQVTAAVIAQLT